jgi:UDP-N-acetylmuramate dehydrogenase
VDVADAVRAIRRSKLPDPARLGNAGSFFKNPEIDEARATDLLAQHPDLPAYAGSRSGTRKLSAAWLIERSGYKGYRVGDAGISERHALVLVNHGRASGNALLALAREVADGVQSRFGIALEPEPVILGATFRPAP